MILSSRPAETDDRVQEQIFHLSRVFTQFQLEMIKIRINVAGLSQEEAEVIVTTFASGAFAASDTVVKHWFEIIGDTINCSCMFSDNRIGNWPIMT